MAKTVLVVDDDKQLRRLVQSYLTEEGFRVVTAGDGQEALFVARHEKPDLIILDLMMPEMDGFAVIEAMQADPELAEIPVILLTATTYIEDTLAQYGNQVKIVQATPWHPAETLTFLKSVLTGLRPTLKTDNI